MAKVATRRRSDRIRTAVWGAALAAFGFGRLPYVYGAFAEPYWSARVAGLSGAYTAIADDAGGLFYNPAAAAGKARRSEASFSYAKLFAGLDRVRLSLYYLGYLQPIGESTVVGMGWANFTADSLYREDTAIVGFARSLKGLLPEGAGDVAFGASVRYLARRYTLNDSSVRDPIFRGGTGVRAVALDLHAYAAPLPGLSLGLTVRSLNRPDVGLSEKDRLPLEFVAGAAYRWRNLRVPVDVSQRDGRLDVRFGGEALFLRDRLAMRFGSDRSQLSAGFGVQHDLGRRLTAVLDYAFMLPLKLQGSAGSHRATMGLKF